MKSFILFIFLILITGCFFKSNGSFNVEEINQCIVENEAGGLDKVIETCQVRCKGNIPCERRVAVIAAEKFGEEVPEIVKEEAGSESGEVGNEIGGEERKEIEKLEIKKLNDDGEASGLVVLSGVDCDNKEDLPDKMKVWAERVDKVYWYWVVPHGGAWELTDLEAGQYKIYYAPERNRQPLAKYSESIADGSGSHNYKILDLNSGGEVRGIRPCDWE